MRRLLIGLVVLGVACAANVQALVCVSSTLTGLAVTQTYSNGGSGYDPFDASEHVQTVSFNMQIQGSIASCSLFVVLNTGQSGNASARKLQRSPASVGYQAYTTTGKSFTMLPAASATANNVLSNDFAFIGGAQTKALTFAWVIPAGQVAAYGAGAYYSDTNSLDLYEGTVTGTKTLVRSYPLTFQAAIVRNVDVTVTGSGGAFNIGNTSYSTDFGTATTGAARDFDIVVRSSDGYRLSVQSANKQQLAHTAAPVSGTIPARMLIPYTIKINNVTTDLSGGTAVNVTNVNAPTAVAGVNLPVKVTLGTLTGGETAGTYKDTLTVTVSSY